MGGLGGQERRIGRARTTGRQQDGERQRAPKSTDSTLGLPTARLVDNTRSIRLVQGLERAA